MAINVVIAGPRGKMGSEAVKMVEKETEFRLVACIDRKHGGKTLQEVVPHFSIDVPIYEDAETCFNENNEVDVLVDLTVPEAGYQHTKIALAHHVRPVVGTTGFSELQIEELSSISNSQNVGCLIAPNFAIGAVLMMKFAKMAATYFPDVDIIEKHHDNKLDAPSGTAIKTAELIRETRTAKKQGHPNEKETLPGARGADIDGIKIHSVRLPGLVAHQEVIFGSDGQTLTIKHDSMDRASFMEGVKLGINKVMEERRLIYGLENIL
ncbi:4-hydroxy-tetrahydrodipicolinate reductase [Virgibacillus sp. AGTR]|uniref:4-hydroxy-tetrahydrodipicolinate reductase n=1 Tax=Virgibacillus salarius TaxID=447199 RepID=A0A941I8G8_9BACI|nr:MULTISPECIES: 4-hydroxy-tetrahydrodipicolinate reductase [Bacillaceae]NAZ08287.1 4-hydroxy-tetrahydrodipicolinate reductase [Agaribacter marinus]MBR7795574.1 4-hydroxy-tetrahydrodipicolinate reductase [Virgibacillus salarius]MCC2251248.1 4-hydroxy-tetrahydrodipicolinate reductase [Virgibacillus sp. AGTR]MDY7045928.1 4-hydroxy-tetrahydrodipicolinate reductase [Virgibacillus sp. M23]QRZ17036.1 4-hydroxy-tetrahydrodipicolinate reductase [Virgibacillus sp. AGTR]